MYDSHQYPTVKPGQSVTLHEDVAKHHAKHLAMKVAINMNPPVGFKEDEFKNLVQKGLSPCVDEVEEPIGVAGDEQVEQAPVSASVAPKRVGRPPKAKETPFAGLKA